MASMNFKIIRSESLKTTKWSGGTTTEIYIYPENAIYSRRDFGFRISTAIVEDEQSTFTQLPGYKRHIMPLVGSMHLTHENHHETTLKPFEKDFFHGDWVTKSRGKCTDFNLMLAKGFEGDITPVKSGKAEKLSGVFASFYIIGNCSAELTTVSQTILESLGKGDFLAFSFAEKTSEEVYSLKLITETNNDIIAIKTIVSKKQ